MPKNFAFLFPGQGSQAVGMASGFLEPYPIVRETLAEADAALNESLSKLIEEGPDDRLKETANAQPAILTVNVAMGRVLWKEGLRPVVMAGHSLGEYAALVLSGAVAFSDAVRMVRLRGRFMQEAVPLGVGTMSAVLGADDETVEAVCREISAKGNLVEPANYNCPGQLVISGTVEGVAAAAEELKKRGAKRCIPLAVSAPFHCSLLKPAAEKLAWELSQIQIDPPAIPYIANVDSETVQDSNGISSRLVDQVWKPVRWTQSLQKLIREFRPEAIVEVGPGQVVSGHVKKIDPSIPRFDTSTISSLEALLVAFR